MLLEDGRIGRSSGECRFKTPAYAPYRPRRARRLNVGGDCHAVLHPRQLDRVHYIPAHRARSSIRAPLKEDAMSPCMRSVLLAVVLLLGIRVAHAADWPHQTEGDLTLNDYASISGDKFATLKLHYTTIGTPRQDAQGHVTNAVLLLHGTGGTGKEYLQPDIADHLFKPGQVLDALRYY